MARPKNTQLSDYFAPGQYVRIVNSKGETRGVRVVKKHDKDGIEFDVPVPEGTRPGDKVVESEPGLINLDRIVP